MQSPRSHKHAHPLLALKVLHNLIKGAVTVIVMEIVPVLVMVPVMVPVMVLVMVPVTVTCAHTHGYVCADS